MVHRNMERYLRNTISKNLGGTSAFHIPQSKESTTNKRIRELWKLNCRKEIAETKLWKQNCRNEIAEAILRKVKIHTCNPHLISYQRSRESLNEFDGEEEFLQK